MRPAIILNSSAANLLFSNTSSVAAIEAVEAASASVDGKICLQNILLNCK